MYDSRKEQATASERDDAIFRAFAAVDPQQFFLELHVGDAKIHQLLFADAGRVKHFEDGAITIAEHTLHVGRFDDLARLLGREHVARKRLRLAGVSERRGRIAGDQVFREQKFEEAFDRGQDAVLIRDAASRGAIGRLAKVPALEVVQCASR